MRDAVKHQNLENMKWTKEQKWNKKNEEYKEWGWFLTNMVKWQEMDGFPWEYGTFSSVAGKGNLRIMEWLLENRCPWDDDIFSYAGKIVNLRNMKCL